MTLDEIKRQVPMREVLARYGLTPDRAGFIHCPFHQGDRAPSLKVYEHDFHCFGCGAHGTTIDFVMRMEGISFKEAFLELGGTYPDRRDEPDFARKRRAYQRQKARETEGLREAQRQADMAALRRDMKPLLWVLRAYPPLSDEWCSSYNRLQLDEYKLARLQGWEY